MHPARQQQVCRQQDGQAGDPDVDLPDHGLARLRLEIAAARPDGPQHGHGHEAAHHRDGIDQQKQVRQGAAQSFAAGSGRVGGMSRRPRAHRGRHGERDDQGHQGQHEVQDADEARESGGTGVHRSSPIGYC